MLCKIDFDLFMYTGEPILLPLSIKPIIDLPYRVLQCGKNLTVLPSAETSVSFLCIIFSGAEPITTEVFKNGAYIGNRFSRTVIPLGDDGFGKYTFVASTRRCGSISEESWILPGYNYNQ